MDENGSYRKYKKGEIFMIKNAKRNSRGQFEVCWNRPDILAEIAVENAQAQKLIKVCDMLGYKPEEFGIHKSQTGNSRIDYKGRSSFSGIALGLALGLNKPHKKMNQVLLALCDALGWADKAGPVQKV
jgi:hypothetical protein